MGSRGQWFMGTTLGQEVPMEIVQFGDLATTSSLHQSWRSGSYDWTREKKNKVFDKKMQRLPKKIHLSSKRHFWGAYGSFEKYIVSRNFENKKTNSVEDGSWLRFVANCNHLGRYYDRLFKEPLGGMWVRGCPQVSHFESLRTHNSQHGFHNFAPKKALRFHIKIHFQPLEVCHLAATEQIGGGWNGLPIEVWWKLGKA